MHVDDVFLRIHANGHLLDDLLGRIDRFVAVGVLGRIDNHQVVAGLERQCRVDVVLLPHDPQRSGGRLDHNLRIGLIQENSIDGLGEYRGQPAPDG